MPRKATVSAKPAISTSVSKIEVCRANIALFESQKRKCVGPNQIIAVKVLARDIEAEQAKLARLESGEDEKELQELSQKIAKMKAVTTVERSVKVSSRLYPTSSTRMSSDKTQQWKAARPYEKRFALMSGGTTEVRKHDIDVCDCGESRMFDKETARRVCLKCGDIQFYQSHIFEIKDPEIQETVSVADQSLTHMQKYSAQFEQGHPASTTDVQEKMCIEYSKIHTLDPSKVQCSRTAQILKSCPSLPKIFRKAPERLTKELTASSIPEFTSLELNKILNQRSKLRTVDVDPEAQKAKKSFTNPIYIRQLGLANNMPQAALFPHAKTNKIHLDRSRHLEQECLFQQRKKCKTEDFGWKLKPFS
jgi:hypothetical protein